MHREILSGRVQSRITQYAKKTKWKYEWLHHQIGVLKRDKKMKRQLAAYHYEQKKQNETAVKKVKKKKKKKKKNNSDRFQEAHDYFEGIDVLLKKDKKKKKNTTDDENFEVVRILSVVKQSKLSKQKKKREKIRRKIRKTLPSHPSLPPSQVGADAQAQWDEIHERNRLRAIEKAENRRYFRRCFAR